MPTVPAFVALIVAVTSVGEVYWEQVDCLQADCWPLFKVLATWKKLSLPGDKIDDMESSNLLAWTICC